MLRVARKKKKEDKKRLGVAAVFRTFALQELHESAHNQSMTRTKPRPPTRHRLESTGEFPHKPPRERQLRAGQSLVAGVLGFGLWGYVVDQIGYPSTRSIGVGPHGTVIAVSPPTS